MGEKVEPRSDIRRDIWVTSRVLPRQGADQWASKIAAHDLEVSGLQSFVDKSDGEYAIKTVKEAEVKKLREKLRHIELKTPSTVVEPAIWDVESVARTLAHAAEELHRIAFEVTYRVRVFAVECARSSLWTTGQLPN